jgi:hypothetical protein
MRNFYNYWANKTIRNGLKAIKIVIGLGLSVSFALENRFIGGLFFGWVLMEALLDRK